MDDAHGPDVEQQMIKPKEPQVKNEGKGKKGKKSKGEWKVRISVETA